MTIKWLQNDGTVQTIDNANPVPVSIQGGNVTPVGVTLAGALPAGENLIGDVGSRQTVVQFSFTRPGDVTAYVAKDVVSNSTAAPLVMTFSNVARLAGESGIIYNARLMTNQSTCVARFRLHLYTAAPTAINDNAQFTILWTNRATRIGYIDFAAAATEGTGSNCASSLNTDIRLGFVAGATKNLFGILETLDAFTPAWSQSFFVELQSLVD